jgi:rhamnose transport system permease protein
MWRSVWSRLKSWEGLLLIVLVTVVVANSLLAPHYLQIGNMVNLFRLSIEKIIIVLIMAFVIINGEIDLSVASVMGLAAATFAVSVENGMAAPFAVALTILVGIAVGLFNGFWVAYVGMPSLVVTLAGLIGYRGAAYVLLEDRSVGNFPAWFTALSQKPLLGPLPFSMVFYFILLILAIVLLQYTGFGRYTYVIGNNREVARYSGVKVKRIKMMLFVASATTAAIAGLLYAARLGAVRGSTGDGFELDIITMVLLGGVSSFGGTGTMVGVLLSTLIILNLRNGMGLLSLTGHIQTGIIGSLLILSVLLPNLARDAQGSLKQRRLASRPDSTATKGGG